MTNFDMQIQESQTQVAQAQAKISELTSRIETAHEKMATGTNISIDIENASLEDVHTHTELMNATIAELIMGLDDVTSAVVTDFEDMRSKTTMENVVGWFSDDKSDSMQEERMLSATVDDKLWDLLSKSDVLTKLLQGHLATLHDQKIKVEGNLAASLDECEITVADLESIHADILALEPRITTLEDKISIEQNVAARTKLEFELAAFNTSYNDMFQMEQVKLVKSQTLERYIEKGKTWIDSLQNQAATQLVLINKLNTDTKQRAVLYDALSKSLKAAQQQDLAHKITETDHNAQTAMAVIGSATQAGMADLLDAQEDHMVFTREMLEQKAKADARFVRRFQSIVEQHDRNQYEDL